MTCITKPPSTNSLKKRAMNAVWWVAVATLIGRVVQMLRSILLAHLLFPEAFGLMALVGVVLQGMEMCSDVGIAPSITKSDRGEDPSFLQTAWTVQVIRGLILALFCCCLAWPLSTFYGEPALLTLLPVAGVSIVINGFKTTSWAVLSRRLQRGRMTVIGLTVQLLKTIITILLAMWLRSVWALVLGALLGNVLLLIVGNIVLPGIHHKFKWDKGAVAEIFSFGKWIFASTLLTFLAMQIDKLMLGKLIPLSLLGVYSIALVLSGIPKEILQKFASAVLYPALAEQFRTKPELFNKKFLRVRGVMLRIGLLLCLGVVIVSPSFFTVFYDNRYINAIWIAQILVLTAWFSILSSTTGYALLVHGNSKCLAYGNGVNFVVTVVAASVGFYLFELPGFILGYALGTAVGELVLCVSLLMRQRVKGLFLQDMYFTGMGLGVVALYVGAKVFIKTYFMEFSLVLDMGVGVVLLGATFYSFLPSFKSEFGVSLSSFRAPKVS